MDRAIQFIGETGKYLLVKDTGTCKEKSTPAGEIEKCEGEGEY
jgi:hypothetical protein